MLYRLIFVATILAATDGSALAQKTHMIDVWGARIEVPNEGPGGLFAGGATSSWRRRYGDERGEVRSAGRTAPGAHRSCQSGDEVAALSPTRDPRATAKTNIRL